MIPRLAVQRLGLTALVLLLGTSAGAQFDPQHNHLVCYKIKGSPIRENLALFNQFSTNAIVQELTPVALCVPTFKACCPPTSTGVPCQQQSPCPPDPSPNQPAPVDHFKCYKSKIKTCLNPPQCTKLGGFPKGTVVNLTDQFHTESNVIVGAPNLLCTPVLKEVISPTTTTIAPPTTTTTTTTSTTTTTLGCQFSAAANGCVGTCPSTAPPGSQCQQVAPGKCMCAPPPVCCQCPGVACFDSNGQCPAGCAAFPGADCNASTAGQCGCGFCRDATVCTTIPCSANQPCPQGTLCDPLDCPAPCASPCTQGATCGGACFKADGTNGQCTTGPAGCTCL